ncbi:hypothetical protein [Arthrobacter antibioticus]|nr:hypothetical protein [Arthrobacter sp. H35-MC1]MDJ0316143.1 hypothetical protein [Arthrobacter sp. H35-MC1]
MLKLEAKKSAAPEKLSKRALKLVDLPLWLLGDATGEGLEKIYLS